MRGKNENSRHVANAGKLIVAREIVGGDDKTRDKLQWKLWRRLKARFHDEEFTHSLLDRLITSFIVNVMVACVWITFGFIAWKLFLR